MENWLEHQPSGGNLITDPTKPIPGFFTASRKQSTVIANRIRSQHARTAVNLHHYGLLNSPTCSKCNKLLQDLDHLIKDCSFTKLTGSFKSANECDMNVLKTE